MAAAHGTSRRTRLHDHRVQSIAYVFRYCCRSPVLFLFLFLFLQLMFLFLFLLRFLFFFASWALSS